MSTARMSHIKTAIKVLFVGGLLYYLAQKRMISFEETRKALLDWQDSVPAILCLIIAMLLGAIRWQLLLRPQGLNLPALRVLQLTLIGNFFNIALPGAVSGDFVKAFYIGKEVEGQRGRAFGSILFDRVAGLSALVLVSASALVLGISQFQHSNLIKGTGLLIVVAAVCVLVLYAYLFLVREHHDPVLRLLRKLEARIPKAGSATRIYIGLRHYHNHRATVFQVLLISIMIHILVGFCCYRFALALGEDQLSLLSLYVIIPLGLLVTAVPVAPAGVGTGHAAFLFLFGLLGSKRGADVFTLYAMVNVALGCIGGLVYLRFKGPSVRGAELTAS